jgi:hypothetical protein
MGPDLNLSTVIYRIKKGSVESACCGIGLVVCLYVACSSSSQYKSSSSHFNNLEKGAWMEEHNDDEPVLKRWSY